MVGQYPQSGSSGGDRKSDVVFFEADSAVLACPSCLRLLSASMRAAHPSSYRLVKKISLLCLFSILPSCANVAAYERGKLAHPTMAPGDGTSVAREHVYAVEEGTMGGTMGAASGCGCN